MEIIYIKNCTRITIASIIRFVLALIIIAYIICAIQEEAYGDTWNNLSYRVTSGAEGYYAVITGGDYDDNYTINIPSHIDGYPVKGIASHAFSNNTSDSHYGRLKHVTIPEGVEWIGDSAFIWTGLEEIVLPKSLRTIEAYAFYGCSSLKELTIPENVNTVGSLSFAGGCSIKTITIENGVKIIGPDAFGGNDITEIFIPKSIENISGSAFNYCKNLRSIIVDEYNKYYDSRDNCNAIIRSDDSELVSGCVTTVIPDSVNTIGNDAFHGCIGLTKIEIPKNVWLISGYAFYACENLQSIDGMEGVNSIGNYAFYGCLKLEHFTVPDGITILSQHTFDSCLGMKSITIPNTVHRIDDGGFCGCDSLKDVYYNGTKEEWDNIHVSSYSNECLKQATIHYNDGTNNATTDPLDKLLERSSYEYNNDLALTAAEMCLATYSGNNYRDSSAIDSYLSSLGFTNIESSSYSILNPNRFTVATKEYTGKDSDGNTDVMVIVVQGTTNPYQQIKDVTSLPKKSIPGLILFGGYDIVVDFYNEIDDVVSNMKDSGKKYKILITGHSLGGAAANLTGAVYNNRADDKNNVFIYTFGAINVFIPNASITKDYENIHNVYNKLDTFSPEEYGGLLLTGMGGGYGKFGHIDFYKNEHRNDYQQSLQPVDQIIESVNHGMSHYVDDVRNGLVQDSILRECSENYNPPQVPVIINATASKDVITVNWHALNQRIIQGSSVGYEVQCSSTQMFESDVKKEIISGYDTNTIAISVSDLQTLDNQYYARIRSFISYKGITYYSRWSDTVTVKQNAFVSKLPNPMTAKAKKITVKYSALKKKKQTITTKKAFVVNNAKGNVTFKVESYDKKAKTKIKVSKSGVITIKKGLKRGTYKLKVKITSAGNEQYKAKNKNVTVKIVVK